MTGAAFHWSLAIDFGTTTTAAAMTSRGGGFETVEIDGERRMPSTVYWKEEAAGGLGHLIVGDSAENAADIAPQFALRCPKYRIADEAVLLGGDRIAITEIVAAIIGYVTAAATTRQDDKPPSELRLTHPARWGPARTAKLTAAALAAGYAAVTLVPEPVAAATYFTEELKLRPGEYVAVYDLGGGTFDTAVLQRTESSFEVQALGGFDDLGGENFDEDLYQFVGSRVESESWRAFTSLTADQYVLQRHQSFKRDLRRAKERLSKEAEATVVRPLPDLPDIRVTRSEFEQLIQDDVDRSVSELAKTISDAGRAPSDMSAIFLAGGSSQIPFIARAIEQGLTIRPRTFGDPKAVTSLGALRAASPGAGSEAPPPDDEAEPSVVSWLERHPIPVAATVVGLIAILLAVVLLSGKHNPSPTPAPVNNVVTHTGGAVSSTAGTTSFGPTSTNSATSQTTSTSSFDTSGMKACDQNISANGNTTCPFAANVFVAYWKQWKQSGDQTSTTVTAHSTSTGLDYTMDCTSDGTTVTCTGGNDALVTFPLAAVRAY